MVTTLSGRKERFTVPLVTIVLGIELLLVGIAGYELTGSQHPTALIPAYAGAIFVTLGIFAAIMSKGRKHLMHLAAMMSLIGFAGSVSGVIKLVEWMAGTTPDQPAAVICKSVMSGSCLLFVFMCLESFMAARRARKLQSS
jgi:hypothetical protein